MNQPLAGIKVLELARVLAGPVCGQILADLGADVVKVERPGTGDETRAWGPPFMPPAAGEDRGPSAYYLSCNRGKRSLALDFSTAAGREVLEGLIRQADVLIENFLPRSLEKLQLTPQHLQQLNPRLVVVSISGYGRTGPLADKPGYDLVIQATAGIMSITGEADGAPMKIGVAITDVITGLYAAISALAGLIGRGKADGNVFDLALADCTLASLVNVAQGALVTGQRPQRFGNAHPHIVPYEAFATADGYLVLAIGNDGQFARFCRAAGRAAWADDERFATNPARVQHRDILVPMIQQLMQQRTTSQWEQLLTQHDVPHAPVQSLDEILRSPQVAARGMVREVQDASRRTFVQLGSPLHAGQRAERPAGVSPELGQHTDDVLAQWLGLDEPQRMELRKAHVVS